MKLNKIIIKTKVILGTVLAMITWNRVGNTWNTWGSDTKTWDKL